MKTYKFNKEKLEYELTNVVLKWKTTTFILFLSLFLLSFMTVKTKLEIAEKEKIITEKENRIRLIKEPLRKEHYIEDLYKSIGFNLTKEEHKRFSKLALKYKEQIEEAKVPATLVWWIAYKESGFGIKKENPTSTAKGMYQFLDGTWNEICKMKGYNVNGRFNEQKQVTVMLDYLNYLYNKYGNWQESVEAYAGFKYHYPVNFLLK